MGSFIKKAKENWVLIANSILLIVIIFLTGYYSSINKMNLLDVNDEKFAQEIADMQKSVEAQQLARQPYLGDWINLNPASFSFSSASRINITGLDGKNYFAVGKKLRIIQAGVTKYFYIYKVTSTYILITGGSQATFTNAAITSIAYAVTDTPTGFPNPMPFSANWPAATPASGSSLTITTVNTEQLYFSMNGSNVTVQGYVVLELGGVANAQIAGYLPVPFDPDFVGLWVGSTQLIEVANPTSAAQTGRNGSAWGLGANPSFLTLERFPVANWTPVAFNTMYARINLTYNIYAV